MSEITNLRQFIHNIRALYKAQIRIELSLDKGNQ